MKNTMQQPVAEVKYTGYASGNELVWTRGAGLQFLPDGTKLYAASVYAPTPVAYLDVGAGGYMYLGTDLTEDQVGSFPWGRHILAIVGTYGAEGYVPAEQQPAPHPTDRPECGCCGRSDACDPDCDAQAEQVVEPVATVEVMPDQSQVWIALKTQWFPVGLHKLYTAPPAPDVSGLVEALVRLREALDPDDYMGDISMHNFIDAHLAAHQNREEQPHDSE